jgi:hypothetical protein
LQAERVRVLGVPVKDRGGGCDSGAGGDRITVQRPVVRGSAHASADPLQVLLRKHLGAEVLHPYLDHLGAVSRHEHPDRQRAGISA